MARFLFDHALLPEGWASSVAIDVENGTIVDVRPGAPADGRKSGVPDLRTSESDLGNSRDRRERIAGIALPGLPNLHSHTFQRAMAGLAETRGPASDNFWSWREVMYRFLGALTPDDVEAIAAYAFTEMLEGGFTSVAEFHYLHHDCDGRPFTALGETATRIAAAAAATGIGLTLLPSFYAYSGFGAAPAHAGQRRFLNDPDRFVRLVEETRRAVAPLPDAVVGIAPHSLRAVTPDTLRAVLDAHASGPVHIHAAEQVREVEDCVAWSGERPVAWLLSHAAVDERWCLIHATHMTADESRRLAASGAVAGLCPLTEANLGDGIFDAPTYLAAGGRFGIGSDSNIEITAPGELKQLEYDQRLATLSRNVLPRTEGESTGVRLYLDALSGGAQALGRSVGCLAKGFRADIVVLDSSHPDLVSVAGDRWIDAYTFVAGKSAVASVLVGGERVVERGRHRTRPSIQQRYTSVLKRLAQS